MILMIGIILAIAILAMLGGIIGCIIGGIIGGIIVYFSGANGSDRIIIMMTPMVVYAVASLITVLIYFSCRLAKDYDIYKKTGEVL